MLLAAFAKLLLYGGVTLVAGEFVVVPRRSTPTSATLAERVRPVVRWGWMALCAGVVVTLLAQVRELELEASAESLGVLLGTGWGHGWEFLALSVLLGTAAFGMRWPVPVRALLAASVAAGMGGLGHAAADETWRVSSRVLDAVHVLCVGGWIGGLLLVSRLDGAETSREAWAGFSRIATFLAPLVVLSGALASLLRLREATFSAALASDYGRLLLLKLAFALVVLALGALHRKRILRGDLPRAGSVRFELAFAGLVLLVTSVLTGTAPPGE